MLITHLLPHTPERAQEILYEGGLELPDSVGWPLLTPGGAWLLWGVMDRPRMRWGAYRRCRFVEHRSLVIGWDGAVSPCYALMHSYPYYIFERPKAISRYVLGHVRDQELLAIWTSDEYVLFRARVRAFEFPSCVDCGLACDYAERNEDCWGNDPSCADCLWTQDIVRCP